MSTVSARPRTTVGRLTVRCPAAAADLGAPAIRLRTERALASIDLRPQGLSPGAVLIVRQLEATAAPLTGDADSPWSRELRARIESLYRQAARPALHASPPGAASVLFADPSELLACLTRDLRAGTARARWYWEAVLRHAPPRPSAALAAAWIERAQWLPAALAQLTLDEAVVAMNLLTTTEVRDVVSALCTAFDLSPATLEPLQPYSRAVVGLAAGREPTPPLPPWSAWHSESAAVPSSVPARYALGLAVTLYRAPAVARTSAFIERAVAWATVAARRSPAAPVRRGASASDSLATEGPPATPAAALIGAMPTVPRLPSGTAGTRFGRPAGQQAESGGRAAQPTAAAADEASFEATEQTIDASGRLGGPRADLADCRPGV